MPRIPRGRRSWSPAPGRGCRDRPAGRCATGSARQPQGAPATSSRGQGSATAGRPASGLPYLGPKDLASAALEAGLALFVEGGDALAAVFGWHHAVIGLDLE